MNLDERVDGILKKYSISYVDRELEAEIISLLNRMILEIDYSKSISIRGAGRHTKELLKVLSEESKSRIKCISATESGGALYGIQIVSAEDERADTDVVIISSFFYKIEMKQDVVKKNKEAEIIEIYEYLQKNGVELETEFFYYFELPRDASCYRLIMECKRKYSCQYKISRERALGEIIGLYIYIRDFESFFQYVNIYVDEGFERWRDYQSCAEEIKQLLEEISSKIKNSEYQHIIVNWIDALRYDELPLMPKLTMEVEKGAFFENAYTVMPYTSVVMEMMLKNEYVVESKLYRKPLMTKENSVVLEKLDKEGYGFCYIGGAKICGVAFTEENCCDEKLSFGVCAPYVQWLALKKLYNTEQNLCVIVHYIVETHAPLVSGYTMNIFTNIENRDTLQKIKRNPLCSRQWEDSRRYIDDKLDDFRGYIENDKNTMVYLSDHGKFSSVGREVCADMLHICFAVVSPYIKRCRINGIFSLVDFVKIIEWIIGAEKGKADFPEGLFLDYSLIQNVDAYNLNTAKNRLKYFRKKGDVQLLKENLQCRGLITPNELFIKYADGDMRYYLLPDEETNHINDEEYSERVKELKSIEMAPFINPYEDDDFAASRIIYDYLAGVDDKQVCITK